MKVLILAIVFWCGAFVAPYIVHAQTDITLSVGIIGDTIPPTSPSDVKAVVQSGDQIRLTWTAATDNVGVVGYVVVRDGVEIASTTLTEFVDTEAQTPGVYEYRVSAFDAVGLRSVLSETVVAELERRSSGGGSRSASAPSLASEVVATLLPTRGGAVLEWSTNRPTAFVVEWGTSSEYELGSITTNALSRTHSVVLTDLVPGTRYYYRLRLPDMSRAVTVGSFVFMPSDVARAVTTDQVFIRSVATGYELVVAALPEGVVKVRVVRNPFQPARDQQDGELLYEGGVGVVPLTGIQPDSGFITAFSFPRTGTVSAGTLLTVPSDWSNRTRDAAPGTAAAVRWIQAGVVAVTPGTPVQLFAFTPIDVQVQLRQDARYVVMELRHSNGQLQRIVMTPNQSVSDRSYSARVVLPQLGTWSVVIYAFDEADLATSVYIGTLNAGINPAPAEERVMGTFLSQLSEYDMRRLLYQLLHEILSRFINR